MEQRTENELSPYRIFSRKEWAERREDTPMTLTPEEVTRVRSRAHSGQRMPTEVVVMQSVQIGRPQLEQETPVSRSGWR